MKNKVVEAWQLAASGNDGIDKMQTH